MIGPHILRFGHRPVTPTIGMLRHWWGRLNEEVFGGELLLCQLSIVTDASFGFEVTGTTTGLPNGRVRINLNPEETTRAGMIGTIAHEMIHQHQHQNGLPMVHGASFTRWIAPIKEATGLNIGETQ